MRSKISTHDLRIIQRGMIFYYERHTVLSRALQEDERDSEALV